jgi:hypothetical protein
MSVILTLSAAKGKDLTLNRTRSFAVFAAQDDGTRCRRNSYNKAAVERAVSDSVRKRSSFEC